MQTTRPASIATLLLAASLLLSGCGSGGTEPTASPRSSGEPVFASEEEALAAGEAAFGAYVLLSDQIAQEGGAKPERLAELVTEDLLQQEVKFITDFAESGQRQVGATIVRQVELQQYAEDDSLTLLVLNACIDLSGVSYVPKPAKEPNGLMAVEVSLQATPSTPVPVISSVEPWPGAQFC